MTKWPGPSFSTQRGIHRLEEDLSLVPVPELDLVPEGSASRDRVAGMLPLLVSGSCVDFRSSIAPVPL